MRQSHLLVGAGPCGHRHSRRVTSASVHAFQVRAHVNGIRARLEAGLAALAAAASGDAAFTAERLEEMAPLAAPLLASPLVGEGAAWDALRAMAAGLPCGLGPAATALVTAHRLVALQAATGKRALLPGLVAAGRVQRGCPRHCWPA